MRTTVSALRAQELVCSQTARIFPTRNRLVEANAQERSTQLLDATCARLCGPIGVRWLKLRPHQNEHVSPKTFVQRDVAACPSSSWARRTNLRNHPRACLWCSGRSCAREVPKICFGFLIAQLCNRWKKRKDTNHQNTNHQKHNGEFDAFRTCFVANNGVLNWEKPWNENDTTLVSSRALLFCFPLITTSLSSVKATIPCDSQPLHLSQSSYFWRQNFAIEVSDPCFSSPIVFNFPQSNIDIFWWISMSYNNSRTVLNWSDSRVLHV